MGGGKETPRQKMVGMMYLVLTALLALNVSKAVLDAFVAIEENIQKSVVTQYERGQSALADLKEAGTDKSNPAKVQKVKYYLGIVSEIDKITAAQIKFLDEIKLDVLKKSGELVDVEKPNDAEAILWKKYDEKNLPLVPTRLNLMACQAKDQYDVPMHEIIGEELTKITGIGKKMWEDYNNYRNKLCELVGTYSPPGGRSFTFKAEHINAFKDQKDLEEQVKKMMDKSKYNDKEDKEVLKQIYMELTKNEMVDTKEGKVHWVGKTFDHSPLVAAMASITALQNEILAARATAVTHIKGRVSTGEYSFNKVVPLAYGPPIANAGDEIEIKVMMAAFDSDNNPTVKLKEGAGEVSVENGVGTVKVKVPSGSDYNLKGTVTIKKKSGEDKTEDWEVPIKIMKPMGTVSLPEMFVLYRGYDNRVEGVASGYDKTDLKGTSNVSMSKSGNFWIGKPGPGKEATISVVGTNTVTNKSETLGNFVFRVSNLPPPATYLGTLANGSTVGKSAIASMSRIFTKYPPEIPLKADFQVVTWELSVQGAPRAMEGRGNVLSDDAMSLLRQARPGSKVSILVKYAGMGSTGFSACVINVQ
jgi:gliding motility-associated protein GldM